MSPNHEHLVYERAVPAAPVNVGIVRRELDSALAKEQVESAKRNDIMLVLSEAAGNVVLHAYRPLPPGLLFVDAGLTGRNLMLRVCDCGRGMQPRADSRGMGIGLALMGRLSDGLEIAPNKTVSGTRVSALFRDVTANGDRPLREASQTELDEYVHELSVASEQLREDTRALMGEAKQAIAQSHRLRAERVA
jgi:serine/threonine-protein kinase RsbW